MRKVSGKDHLRLLRGGTCREECSERRNTALCHTKIRAAKAEDVIDHLDEGGSVRSTSRLTKVATVTVARLLKTSGRHAQRFPHQAVQDLRPQAIPCDEHWSFVKNKQQHGGPDDTSQAGDVWDHTAMVPARKCIVSFVVGKRTHEQTQERVNETPSRLRKGHVPVVFRDGYEGYASSILEAFGRRDAAPKTGVAGRPRLDSVRWPLPGQSHGNEDSH
jgi:IS1 family transposase